MRFPYLLIFFITGCSGVDSSLIGDGGDAGGGFDTSTGADTSMPPTDSGGDATMSSDAAGPCPQDMAQVDGPMPFCIDKYEVTVAQYTQFHGAVGSNFVRPSDCMFKTQLHTPAGSVSNHPVFNVDWCDAFAYCAWAGKRLCGRIGGGGLDASNFMSASLGMWSRACTRGGTQPYPYGMQQNQSACRGGSQTPVPVGSMPMCEGGYPGIFDMNGNAQEWEDACEGSGATANCAARGGDYMDSLGQLSCADAFITQRQNISSRVGFRCCRD